TPHAFVRPSSIDTAEHGQSSRIEIISARKSRPAHLDFVNFGCRSLSLLPPTTQLDAQHHQTGGRVMKGPRAIVPLLFALATAGFVASFTLAVEGQSGATEAPAGFDNLTNGFLTQADFDAARATFEERDQIVDGLGPVYNAQSCAECHQNPITGGMSQISEL